LPATAWKFYQIHGRKDLLAQIYPGMKKNVQWWIKDRDPDGNGLFEIDHQLETGMDDLVRRWTDPRPPRYEAVDATVYAYLNLRAVANMARELGHEEDARELNAYADKTAAALNTLAWDAKTDCYRDRNPRTGELSDYLSICTFYPLMTDVPTKQQLPLIRRHLLNGNEFWLPHPIPALSKSDPEFDPAKRYWAGPSWPAATSHVVEGFADTAKRLDRSLLPQAAELLRRAVNNHFTPRADFYERYDPFTGKPLSTFRDYMHSWWIDVLIRHAAGLVPQDDGGIIIDPLPLGLEHYSLRGAPHRGHRVDVLFNDPEGGKGLTVRVDGKPILRDPGFRPGEKATAIAADQLK
jgi:glycogen debranching enzyme